ncbi:MAG: YbaN family protein [Bdellovibrionaceae bacterium]|nr:YbaN family protein [Pseudobdellovibrionaceae bacterium]
MKRRIYLFSGLIFVGLGVIGAFLPVLPSTCFFIFAAYCFGHSSERLEEWLINHPRFGHSIRSWRTTRSIPLLGKLAALTGMIFSGFIVALSSIPQFLQLISYCALVASAIYVLTRPTTKAIGHNLKELGSNPNH